MIFTVANGRINWANDNGCSVINVSAAKVNGRKRLVHKMTRQNILDISNFPHSINGSVVNTIHEFLDAISGVVPPPATVITDERTGFDMTNERTGQDITNERTGQVTVDVYGMDDTVSISDDDVAILYEY